jgi:TetR/AcrR family transcriptional regulator
MGEKRDKSISQIRDAAIEVFAEAGYSGARVDEIAKRAGINKAMIYYRVGDKETLFQEVVHDIFGDITRRIKEDIKKDMSPEEKFKVYVSSIAGMMAKHPAFPKIMMREIASGWKHFSEDIIKDIAGILAIVKTIIDEGVEEGVFIEINPAVVHLMVIGAMLTHNGVQPVKKTISQILAGKQKKPDDISFEHVVSEIQRVMLRALKVRQ